MQQCDSPCLQWVYNILDGKAEADRLIYSDPDPQNGFIMAPDMKWDQKDLQNLYLLAIIRRRGVYSMRELTGDHLPLLKNVLHRGKVGVKAKTLIVPLVEQSISK